MFNLRVWISGLGTWFALLDLGFIVFFSLCSAFIWFCGCLLVACGGDFVV